MIWFVGFDVSTNFFFLIPYSYTHNILININFSDIYNTLYKPKQDSNSRMLESYREF